MWHADAHVNVCCTVTADIPQPFSMGSIGQQFCWSDLPPRSFPSAHFWRWSVRTRCGLRMLAGVSTSSCYPNLSVASLCHMGSNCWQCCLQGMAQIGLPGSGGRNLQKPDEGSLPSVLEGSSQRLVLLTFLEGLCLAIFCLSCLCYACGTA